MAAAPTKFKEVANRVSANGYSAFPIPPWTKRANMRQWQLFCRRLPTPAEIAYWCETQPEHGVAIACGRLLAVDIDATNETQADDLERCVRTVLDGLWLKRIGAHPKRMLVCRVGDRVKLSTRHFKPVDLLANGSYFLAFGIHPQTQQPYRWIGPSPADVPFDALPTCSAETYERLVDALCQRLGRISAIVSDPPIALSGLGNTPVPTGRRREHHDPRWLHDSEGKVIDGRDTYLTTLIYRHYANGVRETEALATVAFEEFRKTADLIRPKRDNQKPWAYRDALDKARGILRRRPVVRQRRDVAQADGFWTPAVKHAFARIIESDAAAGGLSPSVVAINHKMLEHIEGDGSSYASTETLAKRLRLHPRTVKRARHKLIKAGYWTAELVKGGRGNLAHYRPSPAVLNRVSKEG